MVKATSSEGIMGGVCVVPPARGDVGRIQRDNVRVRGERTVGSFYGHW